MKNPSKLKMAEWGLPAVTRMLPKRIGPNMQVALPEKFKNPKNSGVWAAGVIVPIAARLIDWLPPITMANTRRMIQNCSDV